MATRDRDRAARRGLVWLLPTRGDVGAELRADGVPALRSASSPPAVRARPAGGSSSRALPRPGQP